MAYYLYEILKKRGIDVSCFGANKLSHTLDKRKGIDQFIHLSLIKEHPMQYTKKRDGLIPNPIWLEIDASVLLENSTIFSNDIAKQNGVTFHNINSLDKYADLEVLWGWTDWHNPEIQRRIKIARRGEIMVKNQISIRNIIGVTNG